MGFKCPNCKKDFGINRKELEKHFAENLECSMEALRILIDKKLGVENES